MNEPINNPIKKQPAMFTERIPNGIWNGKYFDINSLIIYLRTAPRAPPKPINIIFTDC